MHIDFGHSPAIADETDITQPHEPVAPPPTQAPPPPPSAPPPRAAGGPPPPPQVPPRLYQDAWPWLALLGILAVVGLLLWLFVLRGGDKGKIVPGVVGMQQQAAIAKLTNDGFGVRALIGPSKKPRGIVFSQVPGGGSRLDKGQNVQINVSNGLGGATTTTATTTTTTTKQTTTQQTTTAVQQATVPAVTGQDAAGGAGQIEASGFVAETDPVTQGGTAGSVAAQNPSGSAQAAAGSVVVLSIETGSSRPPVQEPNVVGQKAAAARSSLLNSKLTVKTVYKKGAAGTVLAQSPAAGSSQPAWTQITITVGS